MSKQSRNPLKDLLFFMRQNVLDEQVTVFKQLGDPFLNLPVLSCDLFCFLAGRTTSRAFCLFLLEPPASLGHRLEDVFCNLADHVKLA